MENKPEERIPVDLWESYSITDAMPSPPVIISLNWNKLSNYCNCRNCWSVFVSLSVSLAVQMGEYTNLMIILCVFANALFYLAHWQTYVCGVLRFTKFDVTEAQFTIMSILIISAIFGTQFWSIQLKVSTLSTPFLYNKSTQLRFCPLFQIIHGFDFRSQLYQC